MCYAARLDSTYLPPSSAGSAGGAGLIHPPSSRHGADGPVKYSGPVGPGSFGPGGPGSPGGPSGASSFSSPSGHGGSGGFGFGDSGSAYASGKFIEQKYNYFVLYVSLQTQIFITIIIRLKFKLSSFSKITSIFLES